MRLGESRAQRGQKDSHPEAESPRDVIGESACKRVSCSLMAAVETRLTSEERTDDRTDRKDGAEQSYRDARCQGQQQFREGSKRPRPDSPSSLGRCSSLVTSATIERTATKMPAAPTPAKARPKMRILMLGAAAQMTDPTSNSVMAERKVPIVAQRVSTVLLRSGEATRTFSVKQSEDLAVEEKERRLSEEVGAAGGAKSASAFGWRCCHDSRGNPGELVKSVVLRKGRERVSEGL